MRCNYPRRRPKAPVKGGDEHRLSMDYIRRVRPCIMHIMDMVAERYKVGEDLCNDPATGRNVAISDFHLQSLATISAEYAYAVLHVWSPALESDRLDVPQTVDEQYKLALVAYAPGGQLSFDGEQALYGLLEKICSFWLDDGVDVRRVAYGAFYAALLEVQNGDMLGGKSIDERHRVLARRMFAKLFTAVTNGQYSRKKNLNNRKKSPYRNW